MNTRFENSAPFLCRTWQNFAHLVEKVQKHFALRANVIQWGSLLLILPRSPSTFSRRHFWGPFSPWKILPTIWRKMVMWGFVAGYAVGLSGSRPNWDAVGLLHPHPQMHRFCSVLLPVRNGAGMLSTILLSPLLPETPPNFLGAPFFPASAAQLQDCSKQLG